MGPSNRAYATGAVFLVVYVLAYSSTIWFEIPVPRYDPYERTWAPEPGKPSQAWFGRVGFALAVSVIAGLALGAALRGLEKDLSKQVVRLLGVASVAIVAVCAAALVCYEFDRWGLF